MARLEVHETDCIVSLGKPFTEIHKWLDEFAERYPVIIFGGYHRKFRHNKEGIEEVRKKWGDKAGRAARLHIERDET